MNRAVVITGGNGPSVEEDMVTVIGHISSSLGEIVASSSIYSTPPYGFEADRDFLNQVLVIDTRLTPYGFLKRIWEIESLYGRKRGSDSEERAKWEARKKGLSGYFSRNMDIDILFWNDSVILTDLLAIPHPMICRREFVLKPLSEVLPQYVHPQTGQTVEEIYMEFLHEGGR